MAQSTQLAPLHVIAFGGMLDGFGGPDEHPFTVLAIGTATALFGCMIVVAPSRTSEVESKVILMGHPISCCHTPVVRSLFIHCKMIISP
jgi:hypothetical protein